MDKILDSLSRSMAQAVSRRQALKIFGAGLAGSALLAGSASAAPQTCVTCVCGNGNPCNPKSTTCTELRGFPAEQTCSQACARRNQHLCSAGNAFHCPHGCAA
jgi:hypothetical protein